MTDEQRRCLAEREILEYLDGGLSEGQRAEIERHLDDCRLCAAAVEGVAGLEWREGFLRSADTVRGRIRTRTATAVVAASPSRHAARRFRTRPHYLALAATLVLGVGAAFILTRPGPGEALFQRYFEPYPSTQPVLRAAMEGRSNALSLYEARDYRGALASFENDGSRESNDPETVFYTGLSRLALGQVREATVDLEKVLKLGDDELQAPAAWYLALAHLRGGDIGVARAHLQRIAGTEGFYRIRARELLSEMDHLAGGR